MQNLFFWNIIRKICFVKQENNKNKYIYNYTFHGGKRLDYCPLKSQSQQESSSGVSYGHTDLEMVEPRAIHTC